MPAKKKTASAARNPWRAASHRAGRRDRGEGGGAGVQAESDFRRREIDRRPESSCLIRSWSRVVAFERPPRVGSAVDYVGAKRMSDHFEYTKEDQIKFMSVDAEVVEKMRLEIDAAIRAARAAFSSRLNDGVSSEIPAPPEGYFWSIALQQSYCRLCDADPQSLANGDRAKAVAPLENLKNIADSWTAGG